MVSFFNQFNFSIVQCNKIIKCILWTSPKDATNKLWQGNNYWFKILWTSTHVILIVQLLHFNMWCLEAFPPLFGSLNTNFKVNPSLSGTTKNVTLWFSWIHQTLKNHRKHLNKYCHIFFINTFIKFHKFWNLNNIKNIVYFDVPSHCMKEHSAGSLNFLVNNTNLKHNLKFFLWIFSLK
jgi:hypothetical protein